MTDWSGTQGRLVALGAMEWLSGLRASPPPEVVRADGWVDLKGFDLVAAAFEQAGGKREPNATILVPSVHWQRIDFTGANLSGLYFKQVVLEDCVLDKADLRGSRWQACRVSRSTFRGTDMRDSALSLRTGIRKTPSQWTSCDFEGARYSGDWLSYTEFENCRLHFKTWTDIHYYNCRFTDCSFGGRMVRVHFDARDVRDNDVRPNWRREPLFPSTFVNCDFESANLWDVAFHGCTFSGVTWPQNARVLEVQNFGVVLDHVLANASQLDSPGMRLVRSLHVAESKVATRAETTHILNLDVFAKDPPEVSESYIEALRQATESLGLPPPVIHGDVG